MFLQSSIHWDLVFETYSSLTSNRDVFLVFCDRPLLKPNVSVDLLFNRNYDLFLNVSSLPLKTENVNKASHRIETPACCMKVLCLIHSASISHCWTWTLSLFTQSADFSCFTRQIITTQVHQCETKHTNYIRAKAETVTELLAHPGEVFKESCTSWHHHVNQSYLLIQKNHFSSF